MSFEVMLDLGTRCHACLQKVPIEPLPSGLPQAVIAVKVPKSVTLQKRLWRIFEKEPTRRETARWREAKGFRGARWWIAGPFAHGGPRIDDILRVLMTDPARRSLLLHQKRVVLVNPFTDEELPIMPDTPETPSEPESDAETSDPDAPDPNLPYVEGGPPPVASPEVKAIVAKMKGAEFLTDHDRREVEGFAQWLREGGMKNGPYKNRKLAGG